MKKFFQIYGRKSQQQVATLLIAFQHKRQMANYFRRFGKRKMLIQTIFLFIAIMHRLLTIKQGPKAKQFQAIRSGRYFGIKARINRRFIMAQKFCSTEMLFSTNQNFAIKNYLDQVLNQWGYYQRSILILLSSIYQ